MYGGVYARFLYLFRHQDASKPRRTWAQGLLPFPGAMHSRRGFTLIELMVTVLVISILALMAIPALTKAQDDRVAYQETVMISQLLRRARTLAVGRGAAVLVTITSNGTSDRGTFAVYEGVRANGSGAAGSDTPQPACRFPTDWTNAAMKRKVADLAFNGAGEAAVGIQTTVQVYETSTPTGYTSLNICFAPSGRSYISSTLDFNGKQPNLAPVTIDLSRIVNGAAEGLRRRVALSPAGATTIQLL